MMYTAIIEDTEKNTTIFKETYDNIDTCLNRLMCTIYVDIGNGGMSAEKKDGSIGSFWRCADEVYDVLRNGGIEYYADRKFYISTEDEEKEKEKDVKYTFYFSTILDTKVEISGKNYNDALGKAMKWADEQISSLKDEMKNTKTSWATCDSWKYEGEYYII